MLGGRAVRVSRRAGDVAFLLQSLAQLFIGLPNMLAQNVSAGGLVAAEVVHWADRLVDLNSRSRTRPIRRSRRLARNQAAHRDCDNNANRHFNHDGTDFKEFSHPLQITARCTGLPVQFTFCNTPGL